MPVPFSLARALTPLLYLLKGELSFDVFDGRLECRIRFTVGLHLRLGSVAQIRQASEVGDTSWLEIRVMVQILRQEEVREREIERGRERERDIQTERQTDRKVER